MDLLLLLVREVDAAKHTERSTAMHSSTETIAATASKSTATFELIGFLDVILWGCGRVLGKDGSGKGAECKDEDSDRKKSYFRKHRYLICE
jgi:hypothetical protein